MKVRLLPKAKEDIALLTKLKEEDCAARGIPYDGEVYDWDISFYKNILLGIEYKVDSEEISNYFPLQSTVNSLLAIYEQTMRLKFYKVLENELRFGTKMFTNTMSGMLQNPENPKSSLDISILICILLLQSLATQPTWA